MIDYNYSNIIISFEKLYEKFQFSSFNLLIQYKQLHSESNNNNNNNYYYYYYYFRFVGNWNTFCRLVPLENFQKKWKISKGGPVFLVGFF